MTSSTGRKMILTIIVFILILGLLIIAHEFGHFIVAKLSGIKVEEFAFGFPPTIWKKKKGDTVYKINALPLGGYVKMLGEDESVEKPRSYSIQPPLKKVAVVVAGVVMNMILAWFLLAIGFSVGMAPILSSAQSVGGTVIKTSVIVADVKADSPAAKIGLRAEDQINYIADQTGQKVSIGQGTDLTAFTTNHKGQRITVGFTRGGQEMTATTVLSSDQTQPLGVAAVDNSIVRVPVYRAPWVALVETGKIFKLTFDFIGGLLRNIFVKGQVSQDVGGPVAIYMYTGIAVKLGVMAVLQFVAILSVNLALINILPLPALDGGKILFIILRRIMGRYFIKEHIENYIHLVGFILLIALLVLITFKDISKFF